MPPLSKTLAIVAALAMQVMPVAAEQISEVQVRTHPSQGKVVQVVGASARLISGPRGVFVNLATNGLKPGNVYTLLMAVMNNPGQCPVLPCTPKDVLKRSDIVGSDVAYAGGAIATDAGKVVFAHFQPIGLFRDGFFKNGLTRTDGIEIHLVLNDHGPLIEGRALEMLTTYRGGCSDKSIPGPMPATARAQGKPGPNKCRMVQFAQFVPDKPAS